MGGFAAQFACGLSSFGGMGTRFLIVLLEYFARESSIVSDDSCSEQFAPYFGAYMEYLFQLFEIFALNIRNGKTRGALLLDFSESPENRGLFTEVTGLS